MADNLKSKFRDRMKNKTKKVITEQSQPLKQTLILSDTQKDITIANTESVNNKDILIKTSTEEEKELEKVILKHKIVKKIEKTLQDKNSELDIISSQLYIIDKIENQNKNIEDIKEQQKLIIELKKKIEKIKEQLKIYDSNEVISNAIQLDEKSLIDDILNYKRMLEIKEELNDEYENIKEYIYLTEQIDKVNDKCIELDEKKTKELERLNISDEEFRQLGVRIIKEDETTELIKKMILEQTNEIETLENDIDKIEEKYETIYNYDLFEKLISLELKYLALLSLSPFYNTLPFIALAASTTKDMINALTNTKLIRTEEKISYYAKDYTKNIEEICYKVNNLEKMLNESLYSINNIKEEFSNNPDLVNNPKYEELLPKIEKLEDILKENISKVEIHKVKLNKNKNRNEEKMKKVLELNRK